MENKIATSVRCLFPEINRSPTQCHIKLESTTPEKSVSRFNVIDIIKKDETENSDSSDDSGTDALHTTFEDAEGNIKSKYNANEATTNGSESINHDVIGAKHSPEELTAVPATVIKEYPSPSFYYPGGYVPRSTFYPMFLPGPYPTAYPGSLPSQFFPHTMSQIPPVPQTATASTIDKQRVQVHYDDSDTSDHTHRSPSPAASTTSSGVYSDSVPSPTSSTHRVTSPAIEAVAPQKNVRVPSVRTSYSQRQVRVMEKAFSESRYPDYEVFETMSAELDIPVKKLKVWFQNKRARSRSRVPSPDTLTSIMSSTPAYGYMAPYSMMPFPYPSAPVMPMYPGYPYPSMFPSPIC
ncbi:paired mesoderm homeobox protein 2-like [Haliotis rufescens]|uniref:paired mesoderm homeobox protein 2-like n=1 Tax=Haliotis rufescens TaxID=6454 RepID=UPI00201EB6E1|nr:paired mesoderm homeobox protein 2-like [Haliotis rufescens]